MLLLPMQRESVCKSGNKACPLNVIEITLDDRRVDGGE